MKNKLGTIKQISNLAKEVSEDNPFLASILYSVAGAVASNTEEKLSDVVAVYIQEQINKYKAQQN